MGMAGARPAPQLLTMTWPCVQLGPHAGLGRRSLREALPGSSQPCSPKHERCTKILCSLSLVHTADASNNGGRRPTTDPKWLSLGPPLTQSVRLNCTFVRPSTNLAFGFCEPGTRRLTRVCCRRCGWCTRRTRATAAACTVTCGGAGTRANRASGRPWLMWPASRSMGGASHGHLANTKTL